MQRKHSSQAFSSQEVLPELKAFITNNGTTISASEVLAKVNGIGPYDVEALLKSTLERVRTQQDPQSATTLIRLTEEILVQTPNENLIPALAASVDAMTCIDDIIEAAGTQNPETPEVYHPLHHAMFDLIVLLVDNEDGKRAAKMWIPLMVKVMNTPTRPFKVHRAAASALVSVIRGSADNKRALLPFIPVILNTIVRNTHDFMLQMMCVEVVFRVVHQSETNIQQAYQATTPEGKILRDGIATLRNSDTLLDDFSALLLRYNKAVKTPTITPIQANLVTLGKHTFSSSNVYFGKSLVVLSTVDSNLTVLYKNIRSIKIIKHTTLVVKLHRLSPDFVSYLGFAPNETTEADLFIELTQGNLEALHSSKIKNWIQEEQTAAKAAPPPSANITQKSTTTAGKGPLAAKRSVNTSTALPPPPVAVDVGAYLASSLESQPMPKQITGPPRTPGRENLKPTPKSSGGKRSRKAQEEETAQIEGLMAEEPMQPPPALRGASTPMALIPHNNNNNNDMDIAPPNFEALMPLPQRASMKRQSAQRNPSVSQAQQIQSFAPAFPFNFGNTSNNNNTKVPSPINFSQLEAETPRGDGEDFEAVLSQLRKVLSEAVSKKKIEGIRVLQDAMQMLQYELDQLKQRTEQQRTQYTTYVRSEVAKLRTLEQSMKDKMNNTLGRLNDDITRLMQQSTNVSDEVTAMEAEYLQVAGALKAMEDENLVGICSQVEQHMKKMEEKVTDIVSATHPFKFLAKCVAKRMEIDNDHNSDNGEE